MSLEHVVSRLKKSEGWRERAYLDTKGHVTIGFGFNLGTPVIERGKLVGFRAVTALPQNIGHIWLLALVAKVADEWLQHPVFHTLNEARRAVLMDLGYNMGVAKVAGFKGFMSQLSQRDYAGAAGNMEAWKWRRDVGERRALPLIRMMRTGVEE